MTIWCGGMLRSITRNAPAIAVAVTAIVIEGQWISRKCLADIGPARLLPTLRRGGRELRKLSHVRRLVRHSKIRPPMSALGQKQTSELVQPMSALPPKADIGTRPRPVPFSFWIDPRVAGLSVAPQLVGSVSAHVGCPFLLLTLVGSLWLRRQLKHRRLLSLS